MKDYIDKLKEIEALVELSIGTTMTEQKATDIYAITNDLMCKVKKLNKPAVSGRSELLCDFLEWYDESLTLEEREMEVKTFVDMKSHNCH